MGWDAGYEDDTVDLFMLVQFGERERENGKVMRDLN